MLPFASPLNHKASPKSGRERGRDESRTEFMERAVLNTVRNGGVVETSQVLDFAGKAWDMIHCHEDEKPPHDPKAELIISERDLRDRLLLWPAHNDSDANPFAVDRHIESLLTHIFKGLGASVPGTDEDAEGVIENPIYYKYRCMQTAIDIKKFCEVAWHPKQNYEAMRRWVQQLRSGVAVPGTDEDAEAFDLSNPDHIPYPELPRIMQQQLQKVDPEKVEVLRDVGWKPNLVILKACVNGVYRIVE